jgi:hypothetical protein
LLATTKYCDTLHRFIRSHPKDWRLRPSCSEIRTCDIRIIRSNHCATPKKQGLVLAPMRVSFSADMVQCVCFCHFCYAFNESGVTGASSTRPSSEQRQSSGTCSSQVLLVFLPILKKHSNSSSHASSTVHQTLRRSNL